MTGPIFLAQFAGDAGAVQHAALHRQVGGGSRLQGRADSDLGVAPVRSRPRSARARPTAMKSKACSPEKASQITELSTHLQGQLVAVHPAYDEAFDGFAPREVRRNPQARQQWAVEQVLQGRARFTASRAQSARDVLRRARLAISVSVAATSRRSDRDGVRRAGAPLASDPRCVRRCRSRSVLRDSSGRGPVRRRDVRAVSRAASTIIPAATCCTTRVTSCCSSSTISASSTSITRASGCFMSRTRSSTRRAKQGVYWRLPAVDRARRPLSLARRRPGRFQRHLLEAHAVRLRRLGGARMGVLHQAPGTGRGGRRAVHSAPHRSARPSRRSMISPALRQRIACWPNRDGCWDSEVEATASRRLPRSA